MASAGTEYEISRKGEEQKSIVAAELGEENTPPNFGEAPDGGPRAWLVATGSAFIFFSALGYTNSFGAFQEYYMTHQLREESPDNIAWIGSLSAFLQFAAGAIGGPLFDRFGAWACLLAPPLTFEPVH
jgi:hypothetical protein